MKRNAQRMLGAGALAVWVCAAAVLAVAQNPQSRGIGQAKSAAAASQAAGQAPASRTAAAPQRKPQQPSAAAGAPQAAKAPASAGSQGPRDPFVSPIKPVLAGDPSQQFTCPAGSVRSILVGQAELYGVARTSSEMIAVVTTTTTGRTYFLREGAQLCNGRIVKITEDSMLLEESALDPLGKPIKREVIKKIPGDAK